MLRLLAHTAEDMTVISALVQDAAVRRADIHYDSKARRFVLLLQRYRWEADKTRTRVRSALKIDHAIAAKSRGEIGEALALLSVEAHIVSANPDDPAVDIVLRFSGDATIRIAADSPSVTLEDLTDAWTAKRTPVHSPHN